MTQERNSTAMDTSALFPPITAIEDLGEPSILFLDQPEDTQPGPSSSVSSNSSIVPALFPPLTATEGLGEQVTSSKASTLFPPITAIEDLGQPSMTAPSHFEDSQPGSSRPSSVSSYSSIASMLFPPITAMEDLEEPTMSVPSHFAHDKPGPSRPFSVGSYSSQTSALFPPITAIEDLGQPFMLGPGYYEENMSRPSSPSSDSSCSTIRAPFPYSTTFEDLDDDSSTCSTTSTVVPPISLVEGLGNPAAPVPSQPDDTLSCPSSPPVSPNSNSASALFPPITAIEGLSELAAAQPGPSRPVAPTPLGIDSWRTEVHASLSSAPEESSFASWVRSRAPKRAPTSPLSRPHTRARSQVDPQEEEEPESPQFIEFERLPRPERRASTKYKPAANEARSTLLANMIARHHSDHRDAYLNGVKEFYQDKTRHSPFHKEVRRQSRETWLNQHVYNDPEEKFTAAFQKKMNSYVKYNYYRLGEGMEEGCKMLLEQKAKPEPKPKKYVGFRLRKPWTAEA